MLANKSIRILIAVLSLATGSASFAAPFHVTYLWHMHQPIYYPYESPGTIDANGRFNFSVQGVWDGDRQGAYKHWPKNAVQQGHDRNMPHAGAQMSYSGSLTENNNNLWGFLTWAGDVRWARNGIRTTRNNPRLDVVGIAYHHSLMPLTSKESMIMQIRLHKEQYQQAWETGGAYSKGFWPPECAFDNTMIPALVAEGLEWVIVDNGHLFRAVPDFPWSDASSCRPNKAEVRNPSSSALGSQWVSLQNIWAPTKVLAPWAYQPHYTRFVNPDNGQVQKIIAVPAGRYEGNENGRGGYGAFKPENVWGAHVGVNNNASKPMLILAHSDGDNYGMKNSDAWHGQHGNFLSMCQANADFEHTSVQDYLGLYPPDTNDIIHVEPGSWVGIDGGTPYYDKWLSYENRSGEMPDMWSWSVLVAGLNRVLTADALENSYLNLGGGRTMDDVEWGANNDTARAWRFYLSSETSCYWYWDYDRANPWDGNVTRGVNLAISEANKVINRHPGSDPVGPSIFPPQRLPYNPGGKMWNEANNAPSDFQVWSFVEDVSGVAAVRLYWRRDLDGVSPLNETDNEVYAHNPAKVTAWTVVNMTGDWWPTVKGPNVPDPANRAMRYTGTVAGQSDALIDYFVEAVDTKGNTNRSNIGHVWVGESTGGGDNPGPYVEFDPAAPDGCSPVTIKYKKSGSPLGAGQVYIHIGRNTWKDVIDPDPAMTSSGDYWTYLYTVQTNTETINVCFNNGAGAWDNNGGNDWSLTVSNCGTNGGGGDPLGPSSATFNPAAPNGCVPVTITYSANDGALKNAQPVYIHLGRNGWKDVGVPNPAMTSQGGGVWTYTYNAPIGTYQINACFNNGSGTWDNNNTLNWNVEVTGCDEISGVVIANPASNITVGASTTNHAVSGLAEASIVGFMAWSNSLTGAAGTFPATTAWSVASIALAQGDNVIAVSGTNQPSSGTVTNAADNASGAAYGSGWTNGSNGGSGFGAWTLYASAGSDNAGHFIGTAGNLGTAWGLYANNGALSEAVRPFGQPLSTGQTVRIKVQNHWVLEAGGSVGFALRNSAGSTLWQLFFNGGNQYYDGTDGMTDIGWTSNGLEIAFTLTASNAYSVSVQPSGGTVRQYSGAVTAQIAQCRAWSYNNGSGGNYDYYVNDLRITSPGGGGAGSTFSDSVTITRLAGFVDTDGDGIDDEWELLNFGNLTTANATSDWDNNGMRDHDEFLAGTDPKQSNSVFRAHQTTADPQGGGHLVRWNSVAQRTYDVLYTTDLMGEFSPLVSGLPGTPPMNVYTDSAPGALMRFYRIKTQR